jgi:hypothetical protein
MKEVHYESYKQRANKNNCLMTYGVHAMNQVQRGGLCHPQNEIHDWEKEASLVIIAREEQQQRAVLLLHVPVNHLTEYVGQRGTQIQAQL